MEYKSIQIQNKSTTVDIMTLSSNYHIELNPSDAEHHDRHVIQNVIKEIAMSPPLEATKTNFKGKILTMKSK